MPRFHDHYDSLLCDLDGVVYLDGLAVEGSVETLNVLMSQGVKVAFITNNASKTPLEVHERLRGMGVNAHPAQIITSGQAVVSVLKEKYQPKNGPVLVTGSTQLQKMVGAVGFTLTQEADDKPQVVIQGFNPKLGWEDLAQASFAIQQGADWLVSNRDLSIPMPQGNAPGNGSFINVIAEISGRHPDFSAGKPEPVMFASAVKRFSMQRPLVVGDRLDTDIFGAIHAGYDSALVETGTHTRRDADALDEKRKPHWVLPNLQALLSEPLTEQSARLV